jgi:hypothetical protein
MEYVAIAYGLIAAVLIGYAFNLRARFNAVNLRRARLEAKDD